MEVQIEGKAVEVEDREYSGEELKTLGGVAKGANLVREEADGSETRIRDDEKVRPKVGQNFYHSPKHKRGRGGNAVE